MYAVNSSTHFKPLFLGQIAFLRLQFIAPMFLSFGLLFPKYYVNKCGIMYEKSPWRVDTVYMLMYIAIVKLLAFIKAITASYKIVWIAFSHKTYESPDYFSFIPQSGSALWKLLGWVTSDTAFDWE